MMADAPQNLTPETATPLEAGDLFGHKGLSVGSDVPSLFTYGPLADAAAPSPMSPPLAATPLPT